MNYSRNDPAPSISSLIAFLKEAAKRSKKTYAYRGQVTEYDLPLIPSAYREFIQDDGPSTQPANLFAGCGDTVANIFMPLSLIDFTSLLILKRMPASELLSIDPALSSRTMDSGNGSLRAMAKALLAEIDLGGSQAEVLASIIKNSGRPSRTDKYGIIDRVCRLIIRGPRHHTFSYCCHVFHQL